VCGVSRLEDKEYVGSQSLHVAHGEDSASLDVHLRGA